MKIKDITEGLYREPQEFVNPEAIQVLNKKYPPIVTNLIKNDEQEGLFDITKFDVNKDYERNKVSQQQFKDLYQKMGVAGELDPKKSSRAWTQLARSLDNKTGIYGWWSPDSNYFNIGTTADPTGHTFLDRTRFHLAGLTKNPTEFLEKAWRTYIIQRGKNTDIKPYTPSVERFLKTQLENIKVVFWEIPKPENFTVKQMDAVLKSIEQRLTMQYRPVTNRANIITGRSSDTIKQLFGALDQPNLEPQDIKKLTAKLRDELNYLKNHLEIAQPKGAKGKLLTQIHQSLDNHIDQLTGQIDNLQVEKLKDLLSTIKNLLNVYHESETQRQEKNWLSKHAQADQTFATFN